VEGSACQQCQNQDDIMRKEEKNCTKVEKIGPRNRRTKREDVNVASEEERET